ncbi:armadillo-type protein [Metarhizium brunneum]
MARRTSVSLTQIHPSSDEDIKTDIDIIAIHGLDTRSPDTWTWTDRKDPRRQVIWLKDSGMLPDVVKQARIFTCDWPAELLQESVSTTTTLEQSARYLLDSIRRLLAANKTAGSVRAILFIASCLGGIILIKALDIDENYDRDGQDPAPLRRATRGIVFLATPFRGTAFKDMSRPILQAWASLHDQTVSALIEYAQEATSRTDELVGKFVQLVQANGYHVLTFHEGKKTILLRKIHLAWMVSNWMFLAWPLVLLSAWLRDLFSPWLVVLFVLWLSGLRSFGPKLLVDENSASLQGHGGGLRLERTHVQMNKFGGANCKDYRLVANKIEDIVRKIYDGTWLQKADAWIRDKHYADGRLKIERLSGESLPMEQCYINLAIVEKPNKNTDCTGKESQSDSAPQSSPFSLLTRQKVETPDETIQVELPTLFNERKDPRGNPIHPRRILIQGRAGVGKTTLCKKMVYDFTRRTQSELHHSWTKLFDRLLWVPLRSLKRRRGEGYNLSDMFYDEYFCQCPDGRDLAKALWREIIHRDSRRTLYILDGLDEISQFIGSHQGVSRFLAVLLGQPNVIITSRPNVGLSALQDLDLELETIGFYPDQVKAYLEADPKIKPRANEVQSFLQEHWLIQGLVRIPIRLDALCYTWEDFDSGIVLNTMTRIYKAIEQRLWKKDAIRLEKRHDGELVKPFQISPSDAEDLVPNEAWFLLCFAFTGLYNDVVDFTWQNREVISKKFKPRGLLLDKALSCISFLRTPDPKSKGEDQNYHFIHLTFQEYFAARYFVRQWHAERSLKCLDFRSGEIEETEPVRFLQKHKYTARYDIFWRFVAGLLDVTNQASPFIDLIEKEPVDLLGPTHQRLVMHCLSEISNDLQIRKNLEAKLSQWLLFELDLTGSSLLARELEYPEKSILAVLKTDSGSGRIGVLQALQHRATYLSDTAIAALMALLRDEEVDVRSSAAYALGCRSNLSDEAIAALTALLQDKEWDVRSSAAQALGGQSNLSDAAITDLTALVQDEEVDVRCAIAEALGYRSNLSDAARGALIALVQDYELEVRISASLALRCNVNPSDADIAALMEQLQDEDSYVRSAAIHALGNQSSLSEVAIAALTALLQDEDSYVRSAAAQALGRQSNLSDAAITDLKALLQREECDVRYFAAEVLGSQWNSLDAAIWDLKPLLQDKEWSVRSRTAQTLGRQSNLLGAVIATLIALLHDEESYVRSCAAQALGNQSNLSDVAIAALTALLQDKEWHVRSSAAQALGGQANLLDRMLGAVGLLLESDPPAEPTSNTFRNSQYVKALYGSLLCCSFREQLSLYVDGDSSGGSCIINQPNGIRTASFEESDAYDQFHTAVANGRQLWNIHGYNLWDNLGHDALQ